METSIHEIYYKLGWTHFHESSGSDDGWPKTSKIENFQNSTNVRCLVNFVVYPTFFTFEIWKVGYKLFNLSILENIRKSS